MSISTPNWDEAAKELEVSSDAEGDTIEIGSRYIIDDVYVTVGDGTNEIWNGRDGPGGGVGGGVTATANEVRSILVEGNGGADTIDASGVGYYYSDPDVALKGGDGSDTICGSVFDDYIEAGSDIDVVYGGIGNDTIKGEDMADTLHGGEGEDVLMGGDGQHRRAGR